MRERRKPGGTHPPSASTGNQLTTGTRRAWIRNWSACTTSATAVAAASACATPFPRCSTWSMNRPTLEVDGIDKADFSKVVDQCYLCDLCYMTKCPYVPPHEWNVDFPHLMLRAKAVKFKAARRQAAGSECSPAPIPCLV